MEKVQRVGGEEQRNSVSDTEASGRAGIKVGVTIEEQARLNAIAMTARCERIRMAMSDPHYPMKADNPLYDATDEEVRAYIRKRREEFVPKWEAYQAEQVKKLAQLTAARDRR